MFSKTLAEAAKRLLSAYEKAGLQIVVAESCTGGLIAALLTEIPGSSSVVERGFVTYSNAAKSELLGVPKRLIDEHGAVSAQVAEAMALAALSRSHADIGVSVTGIAGPGGGSDAKPVGLVYIATAMGKKAEVRRYCFKGNRAAVRMAAVKKSLELLMERSGHISEKPRAPART